MIRQWIHPKSKFTPEEDRQLCQLVDKYGTTEWVFIANQMRRRNSRQCRERWQNYLCPTVNNGIWTTEEEQLLTEKVQEHGNAWKLIARYFSARTDINIKSHWKVMQRRPRKNRRNGVRQQKPIVGTQLQQDQPHNPEESNVWSIDEIMEFGRFEVEHWDCSMWMDT
jgi:hypothetical protein